MAQGRSRTLRGPSRGDAAEGVARFAALANLTVTGLVAVGLMALGWLAARALGSRTAYLVVYGALLGVVLAWLSARRKVGIDVERTDLPLRMRVGQVAAVELRLTARRRVSTLLIRDEVHPRLGSSATVPIAALRAGESLEHRYTFAPTLRGVYPIGPVTATWSDPFGFTTQHQRLAEPVELIVHPPIEAVRDRVLTRMWEDPPIRPPVSKPWPVGFEFYGMRDYVPGDDLRRVVWPVLAKTGKMMVRESEQGITDRVVIVVDTDREWHSPGDVSETFETGVMAAASAGVRHIEDGFSLTLLTNDGVACNAVRGSRATIPYLDLLARARLGSKPLVDLGQQLLDEGRYRPHVLVLTPHLGASETRQLKLLVDRGISVVVGILVWDETDSTMLGRAASLGCQIVQIPVGVSLSAVFAHEVGAGVRR